LPHAVQNLLADEFVITYLLAYLMFQTKLIVWVSLVPLRGSRYRDNKRNKSKRKPNDNDRTFAARASWGS